jgi:hypothetical protein
MVSRETVPKGVMVATTLSTDAFLQAREELIIPVHRRRTTLVMG